MRFNGSMRRWLPAVRGAVTHPGAAGEINVYADIYRVQGSCFSAWRLVCRVRALARSRHRWRTVIRRRSRPSRHLGGTASGIEVFRTGEMLLRDRGFELCRQSGEALARWKLAQIMPMRRGSRDDLKLMVIFLKSPRVMTRTTRTGATSRSFRALSSRLDL